MDDTIGVRVPEWLALPKVTPASGGNNGVYMTAVVRVKDGEPDSAGVDRFVERLRAACATGHMHSRWAPIVMVPLALARVYPRAMLAAYFDSHKSRHELNELLGESFNGVQPIFVGEGELGGAG